MAFKSNRRQQQIKPVREPRKSKQTRVARFSISFFLRLSANGRQGVVYGRLMNNGERLQFSTDIRCKRRDFNAQTLAIEGQPEQSNQLLVWQANALKAVAQFRTFGRPIDLHEIKQIVLGQSLQTNEKPTLERAFILFIERSEKERNTGTLDPATFKLYERWAKRVVTYFTSKYGPKCQLSDVKPADAKDLQLALKLESNHGQNYSLKIVQFTKRIFNYAVESEWLARNPFLMFSGHYKPTKIEYLTEKELDALEKTDKLSAPLQRVLSVYLFMAYTGLCWRDTEQLTPANIGTHEETGVRFIEKTRQKSKSSALVPLIPQAERLLAKWAPDPQCKANGRLVPVPPNQTMNNFLKEIAALVGIHKRMTTHMARRTFITLFFERGMNLKTVSAMAGHTNTVITEKHYLKVTPGKIIKEMQVIYPDMGKSDNSQLGNEDAA